MDVLRTIDITPGELTPYLRLDEVLIELAHSLQEVLSENFIGLYLSGSLAIGDFDLTSDVDFIVVTNHELDDDEVKKVLVVHTDLISRDSRWVKHLEYSFFPKDKLNAPSSLYSSTNRNDNADRQLWYFNNGSATIEKSDHDNTLVTRWTLREKGVAVLGDEPASFMPLITKNELRTEIKNSIRGWGLDIVRDWRHEILADNSPFYNRFFQAFFVLHYCRVLQDLQEGRITSKLEGVQWAKTHLDPKWHALIDYCWEDRQDITINISQPANPEVFEQVISFSEYATLLGEEYKLPL